MNEIHTKFCVSCSYFIYKNALLILKKTCLFEIDIIKIIWITDRTRLGYDVMMRHFQKCILLPKMMTISISYFILYEKINQNYINILYMKLTPFQRIRFLHFTFIIRKIYFIYVYVYVYLQYKCTNIYKIYMLIWLLR